MSKLWEKISCLFVTHYFDIFSQNCEKKWIKRRKNNNSEQNQKLRDIKIRILSKKSELQDLKSWFREKSSKSAKILKSKNLF